MRGDPSVFLNPVSAKTAIETNICIMYYSSKESFFDILFTELEMWDTVLYKHEELSTTGHLLTVHVKCIFNRGLTGV